MKKILSTFVLCLGILSLNAQFTTDYLRAADDYFRKADYYSAAQYYEKYLGTSTGKESSEGFNPYVVQSSSKKSTGVASTKEQAIYNTAESYRQLNYHLKAEPFYQQALSFDPSKFPLATFWFATTERALGKYEEAEKAFTTFLNNYTSNDQYRETAMREVANLQFIRSELQKKDLDLYTVNQAGAGWLDSGAVYAPVWLNSNVLVFTSTKQEPGDMVAQTYTNRLFQVDYSNKNLDAAQILSISQPMDIHQGVAAFTPDRNTMFFTRWSTEDGKSNATIWKSVKNAQGWGEPVQLDGMVNSAGSNSQQPFIMAGKYLVYSSDKGGGAGGFDLWYSELDAAGNPGASLNLGNMVNTKFDEQAPYYHEPSGTLVFSSNGRVGMGGYDFFYSKGTIGNFGAAKNFGYPVNSIKDDLYFSSKGSAKNILEDVLLSSDRNAACCLQMFSLKKVIPLKQIDGLVVACDTRTPLPGAVVMIMDTVNNRTVLTKTTDASGRYNFTMEEFQPLKAVATLSGYHPGAIHFDEPGAEGALQLNNPAICLVKIPEVGTVEVLENVYFEFNKAIVLEESFEALDKLVELLNQNPNMEIEISGHTDSKGNDEYNQKLSEERAISVVDYIVSKGIDKSRLTAVGYGELQPVAPNQNADGSDNPEGRKKNRRTEFKVLKN